MKKLINKKAALVLVLSFTLSQSLMAGKVKAFCAGVVCAGAFILSNMFQSAQAAYYTTYSCEGVLDDRTNKIAMNCIPDYGGCFSGDTKVKVVRGLKEKYLHTDEWGNSYFINNKKNKKRNIKLESTSLRELRTGDWIVLGKEGNQIHVSKVGRFVHRQPQVEVDMKKVYYSGGRHITLTENHRVYISADGEDFSLGTTKEISALLERGKDCYLMKENGKAVKIIRIQDVASEGLYLPLTEAGYFIANGVKVHCSTDDGNLEPETWLAGAHRLGTEIHDANDEAIPNAGAVKMLSKASAAYNWVVGAETAVVE